MRELRRGEQNNIDRPRGKFYRLSIGFGLLPDPFSLFGELSGNINSCKWLCGFGIWHPADVSDVLERVGISENSCCQFLGRLLTRKFFYIFLESLFGTFLEEDIFTQLEDSKLCRVTRWAKSWWCAYNFFLQTWTYNNSPTLSAIRKRLVYILYVIGCSPLSQVTSENVRRVVNQSVKR